jgi:thiol peroxidase
MGSVTLKGNKVATEGTFLAPPELAPDFVLVNRALENVTLRNYKGKKKVLATLPSVDTAVCSQESMQLEKLATAHPEMVFLIISKDLPFSQDKFCTGAKLSNVIFLADIRPTSLFGKDYGVLVIQGPIAGLFARSIIVLNEEDQVVYSELVPEIAELPNFTALTDHLV